MSRSTLSIRDETKSEFDELKPSDASQDDFLNTLLDAYTNDDTTEDRTSEILNRIDELEHQIPDNTVERLSRLR